MNGFFYQASFCAECGNRIDARSGWRPTYFCADCRRRLARRALLRPLGVGALGVLLGAVLLGRGLPRPSRGGAPGGAPNASPPSVSAHDASLVPRAPAAAPTPDDRVACGARTKKGTPCKRLVPPGTRCAQHRGKPAMGTGNGK